MAGTTPTQGRQRATINAINVTPMVDVMLVLLVIMMVSANFVVIQHLGVDLPTAASTDGPSPQVLAVFVLHDGTIRVEGAEVSLAELDERLRQEAARNPETSLVISADSAALHGRVVHVMDTSRQAGIRRFAIQIEHVGGAAR